MKYALMVLSLAALLGCGKTEKEATETAATGPKLADEARLDAMLAQYAPYEITNDLSDLPDQEKQMLKKLVEASALINDLYLRQTSLAGIEYRKQLDPNNPLHQKALTLLRRNGMPYDQLQDYETFIGETPYYAGNEIYPRGMTAEQFDAFHANASEEVQAEMMYPYTVIREDGNGGYKPVRYHIAYKEHVDKIADLLREAADLASNESFFNYLRLKADALQNDNYFDADAAWIDMKDNKYDLCIGPFETYSDGIKGVKAKYESFVEIVDQEESARLEVYKKHLSSLEQNLPIPDEYKSNVKGLTAKFVIVRGIHRGGEAIHGYQAVAANLPNDPRVHKEKGTVKTFWTEMFKARFDTIITPVSAKLIDETQLSHLSYDGFFQFVLMHEICHAVGPREVKVGPNKGMAANASIGPRYNALEEAKADITGLLSLAWLMDNKVVDAEREMEFYVSYLGSLFRSMRFGKTQAHGSAAITSLHYLMAEGAITYNPETKRFSIVSDKFRKGVRNLAAELLLLLGNGKTEDVVAFFEKWTADSPELKSATDTVVDLPIDVLPTYTIKWE